MEENIGKRLSEFRKRKGYSQEELASKLNVSRQSIINWENGDATPSLYYLKDLANLYGVSIDDLINVNKPIDDCYKKDKERTEHIHINKKGVFINVDDDHVTISKDGIKITDTSGDEFTLDNKKEKNKKFYKKLGSLIDGSMLILVCIAYLVLGFIDNNYFSLLWPMFLGAFIPGGLFRCIALKKASEFPIVWIATGVYFFIGMMFPYYLNINGWHPYWAILFIIPLYFIFVNSIESLLKLRKHNDSNNKDDNVIDITTDEHKLGESEEKE